MPAGRPSLYGPDILEKTRKYIDGGHIQEDDRVPSIAGLACHLGTARETLHAWAKDSDKQEFSHMLRELLSKQEKMLLNGGLGNQYNPTIAKLMLAKHDYSDKTTLQGDPDKPLMIDDRTKKVLSLLTEEQLAQLNDT